MSRTIGFSLSATDIERVCNEKKVNLTDLGMYCKKQLLAPDIKEFDIDEFLRSHSLFELTEMRSKALSKPTWKADVSNTSASS